MKTILEEEAAAAKKEASQSKVASVQQPSESEPPTTMEGTRNWCSEEKEEEQDTAVPKPNSVASEISNDDASSLQLQAQRASDEEASSSTSPSNNQGNRAQDISLRKKGLKNRDRPAQPGAMEILGSSADEATGSTITTTAAAAAAAAASESPSAHQNQLKKVGLSNKTPRNMARAAVDAAAAEEAEATPPSHQQNHLEIDMTKNGLSKKTPRNRAARAAGAIAVSAGGTSATTSPVVTDLNDSAVTNANSATTGQAQGAISNPTVSPNGLSKKTPKARARACQAGAVPASRGEANQGNIDATSGRLAWTSGIVPLLRGLAKNQPPTEPQQQQRNRARTERGLRKNRQTRTGRLNHIPDGMRKKTPKAKARAARAGAFAFSNSDPSDPKVFQRGLRRTQEELEAKQHKAQASTVQYCNVEANDEHQNPEKFRRGLRRTTEELESKQITALATRVTSSVKSPTEGGPAKPFQRGLRRTEEELVAKQNGRNRPTDPPGFCFSDAAPSLAPIAPINQGSLNDPAIDTTSNQSAPCHQQPAMLTEDPSETNMTMPMATDHATEEYQERIFEHLDQTELQGNIDYSSQDDEDENFDAENPTIVRDSGSAGPESFISTARQEDPVIPTTSNLSNFDLVVAREVVDNDDSDLMEAQEVNPEVVEKQEIDAKKRKECRMVGYSIIAVSISIMAIVLGVKLGRKNEPITFTPTHSPSMASSLSVAPTNSPSSAPSGALEFLLESLPEKTLESLDDFGTPQYKAWDWLINHHNISNFEEWRKKQLFALATFYYSFAGEDWNHLLRERWMDYNLEECEWFSSGYGEFKNNGDYVEDPPEHQIPSCNEDGEFTSLQLQHLQLSGFNPSMPPQIAILTSLSVIDLARNNIDSWLSDMLPSEVFQLSNLTVLNLNRNNLVGDLPSELGLMTSLAELTLGINAFSGKVPSELGLITRLKWLLLNHNGLTGQLPSELGLMTSLLELNLDDNVLSSPLPSELGLMTSLEKLNVEDNALTGLLPSELGLMTGLMDLDLDDNDLAGQLPSELGMITSLRRLDLKDNTLSGQLPSELGLMTILTLLQLYGNALTGQLPSELGLMTRLTLLWFSDNALTGPLPSELVLMNSLEYLKLGNNAFTGQLPSELDLMTNLKSVAISENVLVGQLPSQLGLMTNIGHLYLGNNALTGQLPTQLGLMTSMSYLSLNGNQLSGSLLSELFLMTSLYWLELHHNALTGRFPSDLGRLTKLRTLGLSHNGFTGSIPNQLALIPLRYLGLENNTLHGTIPSELKSLVGNGSLTVLTLANNSFSGTISENVCSLGVFDAGLDYYGMGLSFDCSDHLCGCCWCPCPDSNYSRYCKTHPWLQDDDEWPGHFPIPVNGSNAITINIRSDYYPDHTSFEWSTLDDSDFWELLESGSPTDRYSVHSYTIEVESDSLHRLQIFDANSYIWRGWFTITNSNPSQNFENGTVIWDATGDALTYQYSLEVFIWIDPSGHAHLVEYIPGDGYALEGGKVIAVQSSSSIEIMDQPVVP